MRSCYDRTVMLEPAPMKPARAARAGLAEFFHVSYHEVRLSPDELLAAINHQTNAIAKWML